MKFANFVLICVTRGKMHHIWAESGALGRQYPQNYGFWPSCMRKANCFQHYLSHRIPSFHAIVFHGQASQRCWICMHLIIILNTYIFLYLYIFFVCLENKYANTSLGSKSIYDLHIVFCILFSAFTEPELEKKPTTQTLRPPVGALMKVCFLALLVNSVTKEFSSRSSQYYPNVSLFDMIFYDTQHNMTPS